MRLDDPRHGTEAGCREHYRQGERPCPPCLDAHRRRNIMRQLYPHKRPAIGSQRRIRALQAIGHGRQRIAEEIGWTDAGAMTYLMQADTLLATTAERIAEVYERLSMIVPEGAGPARARTWARRNGYAPPLAWNNIDDPEETPELGGTDDQVDHVVVDRLLHLERVVSTRAEKVEAMTRWLALGRAEKSLCDAHGWAYGRYITREAGAA